MKWVKRTTPLCLAVVMTLAAVPAVLLLCSTPPKIVMRLPGTAKQARTSRRHFRRQSSVPEQPQHIPGVQVNRMEVNRTKVNRTEVHRAEVNLNRTEVNRTEVNRTEVHRAEVNHTRLRPESMLMLLEKSAWFDHKFPCQYWKDRGISAANRTRRRPGVTSLVAIQIYGQFRSWNWSLPELLHSLGYRFEPHIQFDVFLLLDKGGGYNAFSKRAIRHMFGHENIRLWEFSKNLHPSWLAYESFLVKRYNAVCDNATKTYSIPFQRDQFVSRLYFRRYAVNALRRAFQDVTGTRYDWVVRTRIDCSPRSTSRHFHKQLVKPPPANTLYADFDVFGAGSPAVIDVGAHLGLDLLWLYNHINDRNPILVTLLREVGHFMYKNEADRREFLRAWVFLPELNLHVWYLYHGLNLTAARFTINRHMRDVGWLSDFERQKVDINRSSYFRNGWTLADPPGNSTGNSTNSSASVLPSNASSTTDSEDETHQQTNNEMDSADIQLEPEEETLQQEEQEDN